MLIRKRRHLEKRHPEATPSGETPLCNRDAPPHCSSNGHTVLNAEGSTCDCTQPIDIKRQTRRYTTWSGTHTYTPPCWMMSGRRMPLYMQRQLCRYIRAAASVPLCMKRQLYTAIDTQRQLPLHTNGRTAANIPFSIKRDCSTQARCMGGGARPRLYNASADAPRLSHTRCTPCGNGRPHLLW